MKSASFALMLAVTAALVIGSGASAQTIFTEDWENPPWNVGDGINNNGWSGGGGTAPVVIGTTTGLGGSQSPTNATCTGTCGSQPTIDLGQTISSGPLFVQSFVNLTAGGALANITLGISDAGGGIEALVILGTGGLGPANHALLTIGGTGDGPTIDVTADFGGFPSGYFEVELALDFTADTASVRWRDTDDNGTPTGAWIAPIDFSSVFDPAGEGRLLRAGFNQNSSGNPPGTQDNLRVFIPEPATLGLMGLGGLMLLGRRRSA